MKRRLFWLGLILALLVLALAGLVARPMGRRRWAPLAAAALALAVVPAAFAKPRWNDGMMVHSTVQSCSSVAIGQPLLIKGAIAQIGFYADPQALPRVGQTFYSRVFLGGVGKPCADQAASLELVLPAGVRLAITAKTPVRCLALTAKTSSRISAAQGCPQRAQRGSYGLLFPRTTREDGLWALPAGEGVFVDVPLRSSRRLNGIASGLPQCQRREGQPPCPANRARDHLQVGVRMYDGNDNPWLVPSVGLFVR
jgi:hypothetical protein